MLESKSVPSEQWLTVSEAAAILDVSPQRVRARAKRGELGAARHGSAWALSRSAVEQDAILAGSIKVRPEGKKNVGYASKTLRGLSFFSGAMGLDQGLERAGIETILACENEKWSRATIMSNRPDLPLLHDVSKLTPAEIREAANLSPNDEIDLMAGGPPCQAFSTAGARRGFNDPRGNVFLQYLDLICALLPRYVIIENVRGLLSAPLSHRPHNERGDGFPALEESELPGGALREILRTLRAAGYEVSFNLYNSANFGTPQVRERVVILASRDGNRIPHLTPTHSDQPEFGLPKWRTFREATEGLDPVDLNHLEFPEKRVRFYKLLGPGQYWKHLPKDLQQEALGQSFFSGGGKTGFYRRLAWDRPSPTLVTHPAMPATDLAHPVENRPLAVEEYKRLQQFPDDWTIEGNLKAQYKQLGNAVPVGLGEAIGRAIVAFENGQPTPELEGFKYSRYRASCDRTWSGLRIEPEDRRQLALSL